jgi:hypothetical protein
MASFLHLVKADSPPLAGAVIQQNLREPGARVTVVLLDGARVPVPGEVGVRRLGADLDYEALLDLIFESDHVVTW